MAQEPKTTVDYEALYYEAAGRAVDYAQRNGELTAELEIEKRLHAEKCELLEQMRTLADYKQERLERREGERRLIPTQVFGRRNSVFDRRRQLIGSWRES